MRMKRRIMRVDSPAMRQSQASAEREASTGGGTFMAAMKGLRCAANGDREIAHPALRFVDLSGTAPEGLGAAAILFLQIEAGAERASGPRA